MEDNNLLEVCTLGNKALCGGYTTFEEIINTFNKELNHEIAYHERRCDAN